MALVRTFTNRGKRAMEPSELKPNGVYAVRFVLTPELAQEWNANELEQWGLVVLDSVCMVRRHWNVIQPNAWSDDVLFTANLKFFKTSMMERQFAACAEYEERYKSLYDDSKQKLADLQHKVWKKNHRPIQKFANWLMGEDGNA